MIQTTLRLREDLYNMIKVIAKKYNQSINDTLIELIQNGILMDMEACGYGQRKKRSEEENETIIS